MSHRNKNNKNYIIILGYSFILLFAVTDPLLADQPEYSQIHILAEQKYQLTRRLDSIEVHKQQLKRQGKSIQELQGQTAAIKDSIADLRNQLAAVVESTGASTSIGNNPSNFILTAWDQLKPAGMFEWVILVIGTIASICVLILVWGLSQVIRNKKKESKAHPKWPRSALPKNAPDPVEPAYPFTRPAAQTDNQETLDKSSVYPSSNPIMNRTTPSDKPIGDKSDFTPQKSLDSEKYADIEERESVESLRRRMADDIRSIQRFNASAAHPDVFRENKPEQSSSLTDFSSDKSSSFSSRDGDLRSRILDAAARGLSKHDISRLEQISVDQVELVLRITAQKGNSRLS
ncbi:MAG: hypothetical protein ACOC4C_01465 [Fibrobacterota bacterium]